MKFVKLIKYAAITSVVMIALPVIAVTGLYFYLLPELPSIEGLSDVRLQVPLRIYSSDGSLLGEFGEKRRTPKELEEIPLPMRQAFLAAEDDRFFEHPGVDYQGILRAAFNLIKTGERGQGGSTITMQLARNFYLSTEKTYIRKISEIFLAIKIERELTKEKILELYLNKIYMGNRSYGVAAAAQVYYGRELHALTLAEMAMIAGLPKAPSSYNPLANPERALTRRNYVLGRMRHLDYITEETYNAELAAPVTAERHTSRVEVEAPYINEMVRAEIVNQFGDDAYNLGLNVYTTVKDRLQVAANDSIWKGLVDYDHRHGYRGVIRHVDLGEQGLDVNRPDDEAGLLALLDEDRDFGRFQPALVVAVSDAAMADVVLPADEEAAPRDKLDDGGATILLKQGQRGVVPWSAMSWARKYLGHNSMGKKPVVPTEVLKAGDVIWVAPISQGRWSLEQVPEVQGALVSVASNDGAIQALTGGFNFHSSKFNRVTQARRQAGSGFKPVVYASALAKAYTPASLINDAPVVFEDAALESAWRPENYSGKTYGPTRLRVALYKSRNLVSIRLLRSVGVGYAARFARKFGFDSEDLRHDLSLALGSCEVSPLQMSRAYSVLANGGYLIEPYLIERIEDMDGTVLFEADPLVACVTCKMEEKSARLALKQAELEATAVETAGLEIDAVEVGVKEGDVIQSAALESGEVLPSLPKQAEQTLEPRLTYQMNSILQDVVLRGTGRKALALGRNDLAGKTGTTNDQKDAWFNGYHPDLVTTVWVGFDRFKPLGNRETGSKAALPVWVDFMKVALEGVPEKRLQQPEGLVTVKINAETGEAATDHDKDTVFEIFRSENVPVAKVSPPGGFAIDLDDNQHIPEQLF